MDHPLHTPHAMEDDGVWDELNHEHSREIWQHHSRRNSGSARESLQFAWNKASEGLSAAAEVVRNAYRPIPSSRTVEEDFGLPTEDPLLVEEPYTSFPKQDFVLLRPFRFLPKREGWGAVSNLDLFFTSLYNYYYHRGLGPIVGKAVVELVSLILTLVLSVFIFVYVDWHALSQCTDESTCRNSFGDYVIQRPFSHLSLWNLIVILYCLLFIAYTGFYMWSTLHTIRDALSAKEFFEEQLGISSHKLEGGAVEWDAHVVQKVLELQTSGHYRIAIDDSARLNALVISQRIMRKENFMVAFMNRRMLDMSVPFLKGSFFSKSLEWSLYFCVLNYMFNHKYQVRPAFYLDPSALKRRFVLCGIAHAIFMPFLLFFMMLHFSMQNVYDMKSSKEYLGPREWTLSAKWTFREFNELPHFFERRMGPSYDATEGYLKLFTQSAIVTTLGRLLVLIGGSLGAILVAFAALNDAILLHVKIGDWNLLWYVGVLGVVYSAGKALQPSPEVHPTRYIRNLFGEMESALSQVATHTHHYPEVWKARAWDTRTYKQVSALFQYKAKLFVYEVISVMLAPVVLCVSLPKCAEHICEFVMAIKAEVPGAGDVCGYSTFNFDVFGDENWEGRTMGDGGQSELTGSISASVLMTNNVDAATQMHPKPKAMQGKMEKSFFSFKSTHPSWQSTESGQTLLDRVETYKQEESIALARERQHHIEAAARQLETLAQIEKARQSGVEGKSPPHLDESYIGRAAGGADSGGGFVQPGGPPTRQANDGLVHQPPEEAAGYQHHGTATDRHLANQSAGLPQHYNRPSGMQSLSPTSPAALSVLHYADVGLSTELRRMLGRSSLDHEFSALGSFLGGASTAFDPLASAAGRVPSQMSEDELEARDRATERQYQWLERYHSHMAGQRQLHSDVQNTGMAHSFVAPSSRARTRDALPTMPEERQFDGRHSMT